MKKFLLICFFVVTSFFLTWCGDPYGCEGEDQPHHCYQEKAEEDGDAEVCSYIGNEKAKELWVKSNPPKDKCYIMVAKKNGDFSVCDNVKGWEMSYSKEDCIFEVINENGDIDGCDRLQNSERYEECNETFRSAQALSMKDSEIEGITEELKNNKDSTELQEKLEALLAKRKGIFGALSEEEKSSYIQDQREKIMENIDEDDVKSAISKEFVAFKQANPSADINQIIEAMESATEKQQTLKRLDDDANMLVDTVKKQMMDYAEAKENEAVDYAKGKAVDWLKENWWKDMERSLQKLERLKENYDEASEQYTAIQEKYEKLKAVYDGIQDTYKKMDTFDTLVAQGKITEDKAKVLKWAVLLQKGLTSVTEYVPVFGSTVSKITEETFNASIKLAEKRAERTTALDKCIEDPLNCDTDNISWY